VDQRTKVGLRLGSSKMNGDDQPSAEHDTYLHSSYPIEEVSSMGSSSGGSCRIPNDGAWEHGNDPRSQSLQVRTNVSFTDVLRIIPHSF